MTNTTREKLQDIKPWHDFCDAVEELDARRSFMERRGYRFCDIPACNCNSWHEGERHIRHVLTERLEAKDIEIEWLQGALAKWQSSAKRLRAKVAKVDAQIEERDRLTDAIVGAIECGHAGSHEEAFKILSAALKDSPK